MYKNKYGSQIGKSVNRITYTSEPFSKMYSGKIRRFIKGVCECGNAVEILFKPISKNNPLSCGCSHTIYKDALKAKKMRSSYRAMMYRCYYPKSNGYKWYGAKGITVCERWRNGFEYFYEDMEAAWFLGAELDRHPNRKGNYELENCRWATEKEQQRNKDSVTLTEESVAFIRSSNLSQKELSEMFGVRDSTISRVKNLKRWA